jgi:very-short-patch-repair endonuclease/predicted transcriptional regulator of viral defense system
MPEAGRKTAPEVPRDAQALDFAIGRLAGRQHAVFALRQLVALGLSSRGVRKRTSAGRLYRIYTAVYSLVPRQLLTREGHWMAAVLACREGAVLSHRTAADLLGLRPTNRARIEVTVPARSRSGPSGIDVHRSLTLSPDDVTTERGIPCTTIPRTHLDLAAVGSRRVVEKALDQAEAMGVFDLIALNDQLARNPHHPGAPRLRSVLEEHYVGSTPTESELEEAFLALTRRLGLPDPELQRWIDLGDGLPMIRADFVWYEQRVIVETDGVRVHGTHQARERDPLRDQRALVAGWRPVRTTWRQFMRRPQELAPTLRRLVATAPRAVAG